jgi:hypothetical protein
VGLCHLCDDRLLLNHRRPKWIAADKHDKVARLTFPDLLTAFAAAVEANDGEGLASLFTD